MRRTRMLGVRCECGLLSDQVVHFLSFVKSGCDAADLILASRRRIVAKCRNHDPPSAFGELVAAAEAE